MKNSNRAGFSLIELAVSTAVLTILLGSTLLTLRTGKRTFTQSVTSTVVNTNANRTLNRIAKRLRGAAAASVFIPNSSDSVSFQVVVGWEDGVPVPGTDTQVRLMYEMGETDNGLDDDGDGLIDECRIVLFENLGEDTEKEITLNTAVREYLDGEIPNGLDDNGNGLIDERGLCFELMGRQLLMRLSVLRLDRDGGGTTIQSLDTAVWLRN